MNTVLGHSPLLIAEDAAELAKMAALLVITSAKRTLRDKANFDILLSGGNTPRGLFELLAQAHRKAIDWTRVRFFWGDERVVPVDDPDSNFKLANDTLLKPLGISSDKVFRFRTELEDPAEIAQQYEGQLRRLFPTPHFDFALQGLGEDGHTASLFPDAWQDWSDAEKKGRWVWAPWVPHLNSYRLTLLPRILSTSEKVLFLVSGSKKAEILRQVLDHDPTGQARYPAQLIRPDEKPLWLADREAASRVRQAA